MVAKVGFKAMSLPPTETMRTSSARMLSLMNSSCARRLVFRSFSVVSSTAQLRAVARSSSKWFSQKAMSGLG